jgi:hypothetical protein
VRRGIALHLRLDAYAAALAGVGSVTAFVLGDARWLFAATGGILVLTIIHTMPELRELLGGLHRATRHEA